MCDILFYLTWENAKAFANSAFTTSLVGALAGAFAGAVAAQRVAERAKDKEILLGQLRNTNASIVTAFSICNAFLAFKKQHVREIAALFLKQKELFIEHQQKISAGEDVAQLYLLFDLRNIESPRVPVAVLQNLLFDRISVTGRPLALMSTLQQTIESLERSVAARNNLIEQFKKIDPNQQPQ